MAYAPILATLGYVISPREDSVLLIHRNKREKDTHLGKYNGLGGKLERGEDPVSCMIRELREESGLVATRLELRGTINWPGFGKEGEDWFGFLFRITAFEGLLTTENPEGTLAWHPIATVESLPMWEGDRHFLPLVLEPGGQPFHATMPYANGRPVSWDCTFLPASGHPRRG